LSQNKESSLYEGEHLFEISKITMAFRLFRTLTLTVSWHMHRQSFTKT